jgi:predicted Zn-dependent peptidase
VRKGARRLVGNGLLLALLGVASVGNAGAAQPAATASAAPAPREQKAAEPGNTTAAPTPPAAASSDHRKLALVVKRVTLANGLRVVLNEDHASPTVAVAVTYDVGSRNEVRGRSGFAHLFEHMMFQGSRNVGKGEHFTFVTQRGGTLNGTTSVDRTNYFEIVPSNGLSTILWLEADRMKSLAITAENFENQRSVVQEEYRMRVSNAAYAEGSMRLRELVFKDYWPHEHDPIGSMQDLDAAQLDWIRAFHAAYYAPNNATLSLAGDFDSAQALQLIQKYFGDAKAVTTPAFTPGALQEQTQERRLEVQDPNAKTPGILYGWVIPQSRAPEHYALDLAATILGFGDSSVLESKMVRDEGLLRDIGVWTNDHRGPDLFELQALLTERADKAKVEARLNEEISRLATQGPTAAELDKARQRLQSFLLFGLEGNLQRAMQLGSYELFYGDARLLNEELEHFFAVTPEQVQAAVAKFLTPSRRSTVIVLPMPTAETPSAAPAPAPIAAPASPAAPPAATPPAATPPAATPPAVGKAPPSAPPTLPTQH